MSIDDLAFKLKTVSATRTATVLGILAAVGGPIAIIAFGGTEASNVPWFVWVIAFIALLLVVWRGYHLYTVNPDSDDISISPNRH